METYILDALIVVLAILIVVCYGRQAKIYEKIDDQVSFDRHVKDALSIANSK
jgi:hypothetical protein